MKIHTTKNNGNRCPDRDFVGLHQWEHFSAGETEVPCEHCNNGDSHRTIHHGFEACSCGAVMESDAVRDYSLMCPAVGAELIANRVEVMEIA